MKNIVIAPMGSNLDALFIGIREFPTEKIYLIVDENKINNAERAKKDLERFKIPVEIVTFKGDLWEEIFKNISWIKERERNKNVLVNVATGDRDETCAAISAAFVNGIRAFSVTDGKPMLLPVLKFSYYKLLTDKKMEILRVLRKFENCCSSLEELSEKTKMSLPLMSYHINGNVKSEGLRKLGLIESEEKKGRIQVKLTTLGKLLVDGYIGQTQD